MRAADVLTEQEWKMTEYDASIIGAGQQAHR